MIYDTITAHQAEPMERTIWQWQELTKTRKLGWIDMDPVVCKKLTDAMQDLGDEDYTYPRPLARSILGPGALYTVGTYDKTPCY